MKKLSIYLLLAIVGVMGFSSCEEEDALEPTLQLSSEGDFIADDATVEPGSVIKFAWRAQQGDGKLKTFKIMASNTFVTDKSGKTWNGEEEIPGASNDNYLDTAMFNAPDGDGDVITYTFTVTDKNDETAERSITITAEGSAQSPTPKTWTNINIEGALGDGSNNDMFSVETGEVYKYSTITSAQKSKVDLVYAYSNMKSFTDQFISPADLPSAYNATLPNTTNFGDASSTDFASISGEDIANISGLTSVNITVTANKVLSFITEDGHKGFIKITSVDGGTGTANDDVTFDVKYLLSSDLE